MRFSDFPWKGQASALTTIRNQFQSAELPRFTGTVIRRAEQKTWTIEFKSNNAFHVLPQTTLSKVAYLNFPSHLSGCRNRGNVRLQGYN